MLRSRARYNGHTLRVKGRYFANMHERVFARERGSATDGRFALADWDRYEGEAPDMNPIVLYRGGRGRASVIDGIMTATVKVKCVRNFRVRRDQASGDYFGTGEGDHGLGCARFYILTS